MDTAFFSVVSSSVTELSTKAVVGASLAIFMLLVLTALFKQNHELKKLLFLLIVAVVIFASTILVATAVVNIQDYALIIEVFTA